MTFPHRVPVMLSRSADSSCRRIVSCILVQVPEKKSYIEALENSTTIEALHKNTTLEVFERS